MTTFNIIVAFTVAACALLSCGLYGYAAIVRARVYAIWAGRCHPDNPSSGFRCRAPLHLGRGRFSSPQSTTLRSAH